MPCPHLCKLASEALLVGKLPYSMRDYERLNQAHWFPRRWQWGDPQKDMEGQKIALGMGLVSRTQLAAEQGRKIYRNAINQHRPKVP